MHLAGILPEATELVVRANNISILIIYPDGDYKLMRRYALALSLKIGAHALRATAATQALDSDADIATVQEWLGMQT
jgi:integrase